MSQIPHLVFSSSLWAQWNTCGMNSGFSSLWESQSFVNTLLSLLSSDTKEFGIWYMPTLYNTLQRRLPKPLALGVTWAAKILPLPTHWPIILPPIPIATSHQHRHVTQLHLPSVVLLLLDKLLQEDLCYGAAGLGHPLRSHAFSSLPQLSSFVVRQSWKLRQEGCSAHFIHTWYLSIPLWFGTREGQLAT